MADIVSKEVRSRMMAGIRGKDTKPEIRVRKLLHSLGYRYRLHRSDLPGRPDIVMPRHRLAVFIHGCFWHGHEDCRHFRLPKSRTEFWNDKITGNRARDNKAAEALIAAGWRVLVIWECAVRSASSLVHGDLQKRLTDAIADSAQFGEIRGRIGEI